MIEPVHTGCRGHIAREYGDLADLLDGMDHSHLARAMRGMAATLGSTKTPGSGAPYPFAAGEIDMETIRADIKTVGDAIDYGLAQDWVERDMAAVLAEALPNRIGQITVTQEFLELAHEETGDQVFTERASALQQDKVNEVARSTNLEMQRAGGPITKSSCEVILSQDLLLILRGRQGLTLRL